MVSVTNIRNKIETRIFDGIGSSAEYYASSTRTDNEYGDVTETFDTPVSITIVPWNNMYSQQSFESFGVLEKGEVDIALKYDQTISVYDKIVYDSRTFRVKQVDNYNIKDAVIVKVARLKEEL